MLDDHDGGGALGHELRHGLVGGVGVVDVVVGELLALHLPRRRDAGAGLRRAVEGGALVRVLAVAQHLGDGAAERAEGRRLLAELGGEPVGDRRVVGGGAGIGLLGEAAAQGQRDRAVVSGEIVEDGRVVGAVHHHRHVAVVLGGGADHRRTADIDVLDAVVVGPAGGHRRLERVEIDHQQVDGPDAVGEHRRLMLRIAADAEEAAVDGRVQRLHAPVHHLRKAGDIAHVLHRQAGFAQRLVRAAGGDELDAALGERAGEVHETGLVGYGKQSAGDALQIARHGGRSIQGKRCGRDSTAGRGWEPAAAA